MNTPNSNNNPIFLGATHPSDGPFPPSIVVLDSPLETETVNVTNRSDTFLRDETIGIISDLQKINIDSAAGWRTAAEHIQEASLKTHFEQLARQRDEFATELGNLLRSAGKEPLSSGSAMGTAHRWWLSIRSAIGMSNIYPVLDEAVRGEDTIKDQYEKALREPMSAIVSDLVAQQYTRVKRIHDEIRDLRDLYAPKPK